MSEADKVFSGSIPENYDRHMVPLIFEAYAQDMSRRIKALAPKSVLETAAGSGAVTRAVAPILGPDASYAVTDLNQPMLDYAKSKQSADSRISWQTADAQALPFGDAAFDLVCCQFGVMSFPTARPATAKPGGFLERAALSCSTPGIASRRTCSPTTSPTRWRRSFQTTLPASWRARRMAITTSR